MLAEFRGFYLTVRQFVSLIVRQFVSWSDCQIVNLTVKQFDSLSPAGGSRWGRWPQRWSPSRGEVDTWRPRSGSAPRCPRPRWTGRCRKDSPAKKVVDCSNHGGDAGAHRDQSIHIESACQLHDVKMAGTDYAKRFNISWPSRMLEQQNFWDLYKETTELRLCRF